MRIGGADQTKLERIHPELLFELQTPPQGLSGVLIGNHLRRRGLEPAEV